MIRRIIVAAIAASCSLTACVGTERQSAAQTAPLAIDETATYEYLIPYGTSVAIDRGQTVDLMPASLDARVGESIRIVNRDTRGYMVGPFYVASQQTVAMRFTQPGTLSGTCDMSAAGEIVITVTA
ncbi:MAG: hypothetical protein ACKOA2_04275 [Ilumatobacteraceae bacterium]